LQNLSNATARSRALISCATAERISSASLESGTAFGRTDFNKVNNCSSGESLGIKIQADSSPEMACENQHEAGEKSLGPNFGAKWGKTGPLFTTPRRGGQNEKTAASA
jgi:hypothetical protein